ncbi:sulfatase-like hydrolase/transferase, partial [Providencia rustigianii]|uniref:sulfatase-like hydrolase/transferase n=1 Tax=Providencia rustigianii TaxID=158850 RepID=UPI0022403DE8
ATQFYNKNFNSRLEYSFALSIIETDKNEAKGMLSLYFRYIMIYLTYVLVSIYLINILPPLPQDINRIPIIILGVYLLTLFIKSYLHNKRKNNIDSFILRFIEETPISNLVPFLEVYQDKKIIRSLSSTKPTYTFSRNSDDIDTYVIVLGESARPNNMSMYGYIRKTTPYCDSQKENMLIFSRAYSPSSVTATAVPIALSKANINNLQFNDYSDNIVHIANHLGLKTFWFSNQGQYGNYSNAITGMA